MRSVEILYSRDRATPEALKGTSFPEISNYEAPDLVDRLEEPIGRTSSSDQARAEAVWLGPMERVNWLLANRPVVWPSCGRGVFAGFLNSLVFGLGGKNNSVVAPGSRKTIMMRSGIDLSIIVPLYNEAESARPLYDAIVKGVDSLCLNYEMLFVDDGSQDSTFDVICELANDDQRVRVVKFRQNYGQTAAMAAGIEHATGKTLITMDGDLQNDPADIPLFLAKINEGYDIVVGWRYDRKDKLITRKIPSQVANWLIGKVTGVPIKDNGCSLKAFRANIIKNIPLYSEMHRFIPAMTSLAGARLAEIKVQHHPRRYGVSKYGLSRIYKVLLDLISIKTIVSFTSRPLLWFSTLAVPAAFISGISLLGSLYGFMTHSERLPVPIAGTGILYGALAFMLLLAGILGELIYKTGDTKIQQLSSLTARHGRHQR